MLVDLGIDPYTIDKAIQFGFGMPMGPFRCVIRPSGSCMSCICVKFTALDSGPCVVKGHLMACSGMRLTTARHDTEKG